MIADAKISDAAPHDVDLIGMAQLLCQQRKRAVIVLERDGRQGEIFFKEGRIVYAVCGDLRGDPALLELLTWRTGEVRIEPLRPVLAATIDSSTNLVLGESACSHEGPGLSIPLLDLLR
jgi:hypothetical protein